MQYGTGWPDLLPDFIWEKNCFWIGKIIFLYLCLFRGHTISASLTIIHDKKTFFSESILLASSSENWLNFRWCRWGSMRHNKSEIFGSNFSIFAYLWSIRYEEGGIKQTREPLNDSLDAKCSRVDGRRVSLGTLLPWFIHVASIRIKGRYFYT